MQNPDAMMEPQGEQKDNTLPMTANNPITDAMNKASEITGVSNMVGDKMRGGMPQTQAALGLLGAGMPFPNSGS